MAEVTFGEWLKRQRNLLGVTQAELALQINCSTSLVKKIESEERRPSAQTVELLAELFNIPNNEREPFLKFARGDWDAAPADAEESPWSVYHPSEKKHNLPIQLTSFVGREKELADIKRLLNNTHILTLIGPGGTGKTRLSIQAANDVLEQYPDGVWFVDFAPILDPELVPRTTAMTVGLREEPRHRPLIDMLCDYLRKKKMLIILDNCEHLVDACARLADRILHAAPDVLILASSREALGIPGEVTYNVLSLDLPDIDHLPSLDTLSQYEAVRLFIDRATSALPSFRVTNESAPALAQICYRLDGIPLAIELAAVKIRVLGLEQIAKRLDDRFHLLRGGSRTTQERHQTLQAVVDWSYNLLPEEEQILFRRLAVFLGGWTLEAAESVCANETGANVLSRLEQLINKSLIITKKEHGISRYHMLETIRQYANEKLVESGEVESIKDKHLEYFLNLAETAAPHLYRHEQLEWLAQLNADYENLRAALELALSKDSAELSLRLCGALGMYWNIRDYWIEGTQWLAKALGKPVDELNESERTARVRALYQDANLTARLRNIERMTESAELSLALAQKESDRLDVAIARFYVGYALYLQLNYYEALPLLEQSHHEFQALNASYWEAYASFWLGFTFHILGKRTILEYEEQILDLTRKVGERTLLAYILANLSNEFYKYSKLDQSLKYAQEADRYYKQVESKNNQSLFVLAHLAWLKGDYKRAETLYMEVEEQLDLLGEKDIRLRALGFLAILLREQGNLDQAKAYIEEGLEVARESNHIEGIAYALVGLSNSIFLDEDKDKGKEYLREGVHIVKSLSIGMPKRNFLFYALNSIRGYDPHRTACILGVLENVEKSTSYDIQPLEHREYDQTEARVRKVLGNEAFESAFVQGQKMSLDDALDLVLEIAEEIE